MQNAIGTHLDCNPIVIFSSEWYCYYLKCYSANYNNGSLREQLFGDVKILASETSDGKEPSFLQHSNFVDTAYLYKMRKDDFEIACKENEIEYAEINCVGIAHNKRIEILKQLITNLEKKEIAFVICDIISSRTNNKNKIIKTAFNVFYCNKVVQDKELAFFERNNFPYKFKNEEDKLKCKKFLELKFKELDIYSEMFIDQMESKKYVNTFEEYHSFFSKVLEKELQHLVSDSNSSSNDAIKN